jgi:hypothetical protein
VAILKWARHYGCGRGITEVGVALRKRAWHNGSGRGITEVGVALRKWAWHYGSGRGIMTGGIMEAGTKTWHSFARGCRYVSASSLG